jgi:hypothetical protein
MELVVVGAGRDGTVSVASMVREIYELNGHQPDVVHEYGSRQIYNLYADFAETGDRSRLADIDRIIAAAPCAAVGNGYHLVLEKFFDAFPSLKLVSLRRRNEDDHIKSLCEIAAMWPEFMVGYTSSAGEVRRVCAHHLREMTEDDWAGLSVEDRFRWYRSNVYGTVDSLRHRASHYLEVETETLNSEATRQALADFVIGRGAIAPSVKAENRRQLVAIDDFSEAGGRYAMHWFRHFSHRAFEADAGYPVRHALTMYHHIIEREAVGHSIAPHLGFNRDKVLADLKSMRGELEKYIRWIDEASGSR